APDNRSLEISKAGLPRQRPAIDCPQACRLRVQKARCRDLGVGQTIFERQDDDAVAAALFGLVEGFVGAPYKLLEGPIFLVDRYPDADREANRTGRGGELDLFDGLTDALGDDAGALLVGMRQGQDELL